MSAQYPDPPSDPNARAAQPSAPGSGGEQRSADVNLQIDPLQAFREYPTAGRQPMPGLPNPPVFPAPGISQPTGAGSFPGTPGYGSPTSPGQTMNVPGFAQAGTSGQVPAGPGYAQPGMAGPTGSLPGYPPYAGQVPGVYPGYPAYAGYPGQMPAYPGAYPYAPYVGHPAYPGYGYGWFPIPVQPRRDTYLLVVGIIAFACSCLIVLGGLGCLGLMALVALASTSTTAAHMSGGTLFAGIVLFLTFALAGLAGGGFCMYHSIRSLFLRKPSRMIWLPRFWIFLLCYLVTLGIGFWLHVNGLDVSSPVLTTVLIYLGAIFPALTILALGIRRLSFPKGSRQATQGQGARRQNAAWPTTWRRLTLALVSGATLSIALASILELVLELLMLGSQSTALTQYISNPNSGNPPSSLYGLLLLLLSVIAPLVEELVKPLAVVVLIGRINSKAEAFTLGLACGIGFNLVETTGYISSGYNDWLSVALVRSGAGLLHGFGAAMVSLGWYYLTHKAEGPWRKRVLIALGCATYAVLQHALWNGSVGLVFLPGPLGNFFQNWSWTVAGLTIDGTGLVNIAEMLGILLFFLSMSGRLRTRRNPRENTQSSQDSLVASV